MHDPILTNVLADIGEIISTIVGLLFLLFWVIGQLAGAKKGVQPPPKARQPVAPRPPQPDAQAGPKRAQPAAADPLRDQVEEFLRRAGQQRKAGQPGPAQAREAPAGRAPVNPRRRPAAAAEDKIEILVGDKPAERKRQPLAEPLRSVEQPGGAGPPPAASQPRTLKRSADLRHESVAEHVAEHVDASMQAMGEHSARLGRRVVQADEKFDEQLHTKFDHEVGTLAERHAKRMKDEESKPEVATPAAQIVAMLTNPEGVRQAILLNEILRRPEERWD